MFLRLMSAQTDLLATVERGKKKLSFMIQITSKNIYDNLSGKTEKNSHRRKKKQHFFPFTFLSQKRHFFFSFVCVWRSVARVYPLK